jgi:hypothetical protein
MWVGVVGVMAKVIEFYIPDRHRARRHWSSPEQRGKMIEFPPTRIAGVTSEFDDTEPFLCSHSMVPLTTTSIGAGIENQEPRLGT